MLKIFITLFMLLFSITPAKAYDIDCKLILCLAGGFPSSCGDAYSYMIKRITSFPPKPPIGICTMIGVNQSGDIAYSDNYDNYSVNYKRHKYNDISGWRCPNNLKMYFRSEHESGEDHVEVFCYEDKKLYSVGNGSDNYHEYYIYNGKVAADRVDATIQIKTDNFKSGVSYLRFK